MFEKKPIYSCVFSASLIIVWGVAGMLNLLNSALLPTVQDVIFAWCHMLLNGSLLNAVAASIWRVLTGFLLALIVGLSLATISAAWPFFRNNVNPIVEIFKNISPIAWTPFAILWFSSPGVFIVFIAAVFPIFIYSLHGFLNVPKSAIRAANAFKASKSQILIHVVMPSATPSIIAGLRVGLGFAWMSVVAAELFAVQSGLGYLIELNRISARTDIVVALMLTIGLIGLSMSIVLKWIERLLTPWNRSESPGS